MHADRRLLGAESCAPCGGAAATGVGAGEVDACKEECPLCSVIAINQGHPPPPPPCLAECRLTTRLTIRLFHQTDHQADHQTVPSDCSIRLSIRLTIKIKKLLMEILVRAFTFSPRPTIPSPCPFSLRPVGSESHPLEEMKN